MLFNEPRIEYVQIDLQEIATCNSCTSAANQSMGSVTTCVNPGSDENNCNTLGAFTF